MVRDVGVRIQKAGEKYMTDQGMASKLAGYEWEFNLVQSPQVNAWCMPGGKVVFYTGILPVCRNAAGIAVVMGHEVAHAIAEHGAERMSHSMLSEMGGAALSAALASKPAQTQSLWMTAFGVGAQYGVLMPFSRQQESEADHLGLIFMAMAGYDPRSRGHIQRMRALYYNPTLGAEFLQRLFGEMDITFSRDQRQLLDWVAVGKYRVYLFATSNDVEDAKKKGLPVGVLYGLPEEGYMSGGFGHLAVVDKGPHPNATKVFVNWILSKEGQLQWQKKSDNNSLRMDIPKDMLTDQRSIPKEGVKYLNASLPQYEDVTPIMKIVEATLGKAGK